MTIRLAGVFAHPDDDIYSIGGTLLLHPGEIELTLIFATSGEAGPISDPAQATRATLGQVREGEQRDAMTIIGYPDVRTDFFRHPDYYLPDISLERLEDEIEKVLAEVRPHVVVTFGPDGMTSHHDHMYIGKAATDVFHKLRRSTDDDSVFQRLYHIALARSDVDRFYSVVTEGGFLYGEEGNLFDITGVPDENIAVRTDLSPVSERKREGILAHHTQLIEFERIPEPLRGIYLDSECFVQVHPRRDPSQPLRSDLFDDLTPDPSEVTTARRAAS
jgi:N-acetyl-1-D-myo-inositol-2-amino-2-deoxy-alpha-D-glucopyranoside deacetylase